MNDIRIPVDPMNPGQFFACCGLLDVLSEDQENVLSRFEVSESSPRRGVFVVSGSSMSCSTALNRLRCSQAQSRKPENVPIEESVLPVELICGNRQWLLDWWLDEFQEKISHFKCWAGQVKSLNLVSELLSLLDPQTSEQTLFDSSTMSKAKFGIDPRSAWNALDFGFSPNAHNRDAATYPAVEVLGCLGLQNFRPIPRRRQATYCLWLENLPIRVARLAAFAPWPGLPCFFYEFAIDKRGQSYKFFTFAEFKAKTHQEER